jgi:hypothetical protein
VNTVALLWFVQTSLEGRIVVTEGLTMCINTVVGEHWELGKNGGKGKKNSPLFLPGFDIDTRKTHGLEDRHTLMLMRQSKARDRRGQHTRLEAKERKWSRS